MPHSNAHKPLNQCVKSALKAYFSQMDGHETRDLYRLVIHEVERPLLECVMAEVGGNQSRAAAMLGISRSTLRKKLSHYGLMG